MPAKLPTVYENTVIRKIPGKPTQTLTTTRTKKYKVRNGPNGKKVKYIKTKNIVIRSDEVSENPIEIQDFNQWMRDHPGVKVKHQSNLKPRVKDFPIANNCLALIVGATGGGKSVQLGLTTQKVPFDIVFSISPTQSFDQTKAKVPIKAKYPLIECDDADVGVETVYKFLMKRFMISEIMQNIRTLCEAKKNRLVNDEDFEESIAYWGEQIDALVGDNNIEMYRLENTVLVILDDCGYDTTTMHRRASPLTKLAMIRRHLGVNIIACLQSFTQIDKDIRRNASDIILNKKVTEEDIKQIHISMANLPYKDIIARRFFYPLFVYLTKDEEYPSIQLLFGGFYKNFEELSSYYIHDCINKGNRIMTLNKNYSLGKIDRDTLNYGLSQIN